MKFDILLMLVRSLTLIFTQAFLDICLINGGTKVGIKFGLTAYKIHINW